MTKIALITGSAAGIGESVASHFDSQGYQLILVDNNVERNQALGEGNMLISGSIDQKPPPLIKLHLNIPYGATSKSSPAAGCSSLAAQMGEPKNLDQ